MPAGQGSDVAAADWPRVLSLLDDLLMRPAADVEAALRALQGDDARLSQPLRRLLAHRDRLTGERFLERLPSLTAARQHPGERVGPWLLGPELGRGGMSVVCRAERVDAPPGSAPVALKLPLVDPLRATGFAERLARERDFLRALQHPGIAALRDAGVDDGQAWLALELVDGEPITVHAEAAGLDVPARLRVFLQVLDAVGHAHAMLVIHRDIKPGNVFVDRGGRVKLLDFGVAKLLGGDGSAEATALTQWGGRAMTPQYASPEQIAGQPLGTATDVYSLGVLLYELLVGRLPYRLSRTTAGAVEEAILEGGITQPSLAAPLERRRALRGDVDAIVVKALSMKPADRYRSAEALGDDIRRHLESRPVAARPAGLAYRLGKQVRRHAWRYAVGAAMASLVIVGVTSTVWQARLARAEAERANAVQRFVLDLFRQNTLNQGDPERARRTTARELLDIGAGRLEDALAGNAPAHLEVARVLAQMYSELGLTEQALPLRERAVRDAELLHGPASEELARTLTDWAVDLHHGGTQEQRRRAIERARDIVLSGPDRPSALRAEVYRRWSELEQGGRPAESIRLAELAVADAQRLGDPLQLWLSHEVAGVAHFLVDDHRKAEHHAALAFAAADRCGCAYPATRLRLLVQRAESQSQLLQPAASEATLRTALEDSLRLNGERHLDTVQTMFRFAGALNQHGRPRAAEQLLEPLSAGADVVEGIDPFTAPMILNTLAISRTALGRLDLAIATAQRAAELRDRTRPDTVVAARIRETWSRALTEAGRMPEARALADDAERILRMTGATPRSTLWTRHATLRVRQALAVGDVAEADRRAGELPPDLGNAGARGITGLEITMTRAQVDLELGRYAEASRRLGLVRGVLARDGLAGQLPLLVAQWRLLCGRLALHAAPAQARAHFESSLAARRAELGPDAPATREAQSWLARIEVDRRPPDQGEPCTPP